VLRAAYDQLAQRDDTQAEVGERQPAGAA
jgi:hypothetical protein